MCGGLLDYEIGPLLRKWRGKRGLSQMELARQAGTSARHLSFVETGRARPSRDLLLRLADSLDVHARERTALLLAAGYAPVYEEPAVHAGSEAVLKVLGQVVHGREPYPMFVVDARKNVVATNRSTNVLLDGVATTLLAEPMNIVRLALHPDGIIRRATNPDEWRARMLGRLHREAIFSGDDRLHALYKEAAGWGSGDSTDHVLNRGVDDIVAPLCIAATGAQLSFNNVVTTFGTPVEAVLIEFTIETFYPSDEATAMLLHDWLRRGATDLSGPTSG